MRIPVRGWRSARRNVVATQSVGAMAAPLPMEPVRVLPQEPLRLGLGLIALVFYLWIIHSYKLNAGDIAVLALAAGVVMRGGQIRVPGPIITFGVLIVWAAMGLAVSRNPDVTFNAVIDLTKLWVIAFCIVNVIKNAAELRFFTIAWLGIFALYPVRGALYNQYICQCTTWGRVAWNFVFENPNDLATLCLIPLGAAAAIAHVEKVKIWRLAGLIGCGVLALIVMLTQSRGSMLALGVAVILLPLTSRNRARDFLLLTAFMGVAALMAPKGVWERLGGLANVSLEGDMKGVDKEGSAEARWGLWKIAAKQLKENPVTGIGLGTMPIANRFESLYQNLNWTMRGYRDTHNTYLRIAAETGVPGLALYIGMWIATLVKIRKTRARIRATRPREHQMMVFIELSVIAFLVASVFGTYYQLSFTYIMLGFVWLTADILGREPWYVPPSMRQPASAPVPPATAPVPARVRRAL
jgi:O-antigen ligase